MEFAREKKGGDAAVIIHGSLSFCPIIDPAWRVGRKISEAGLYVSIPLDRKNSNPHVISWMILAKSPPPPPPMARIL